MGPQFYFERLRTLTDWSLSHQESPVFIFFNVFVQNNVSAFKDLHKIYSLFFDDRWIDLSSFLLPQKQID